MNNNSNVIAPSGNESMWLSSGCFFAYLFIDQLNQFESWHESAIFDQYNKILAKNIHHGEKDAQEFFAKLNRET